MNVSVTYSKAKICMFNVVFERDCKMTFDVIVRIIFAVAKKLGFTVLCTCLLQ